MEFFFVGGSMGLQSGGLPRKQNHPVVVGGRLRAERHVGLRNWETPTPSRPTSGPLTRLTQQRLRPAPPSPRRSGREAMISPALAWSRRVSMPSTSRRAARVRSMIGSSGRTGPPADTDQDVAVEQRVEVVIVHEGVVRLRDRVPATSPDVQAARVGGSDDGTRWPRLPARSLASNTGSRACRR